MSQPDDTDDRQTLDAPTTDERRTALIEVTPEAESDEPPAPVVPGGRYGLGKTIGRGGMGEVVAARDYLMGREVAIKRLRAKPTDVRAVDRFLREAQIQGRLDHPAIPPVHEIGRDAEGQPFFAMKKLTGTTLSQILHAKERDARFSRQRLLRAVVDVCLAVELAHARGVIHRDLKPANIMLGDYGEVYVIDWGVARVIGDSDFADIASRPRLTGHNAVVGTPSYMSPEQLDGNDDLDGRADVYALGRVLADVLALDPDVPPELEAIAAEATAAERDARIGSARELADRIQRYLDGDRDLAMRRAMAEEQLSRARAALVDGDGDRPSAFRHAGRALALDPTLAGAAELVTQMMITPPREMPREVEGAIAAHERAGDRQQARSSMPVYFALLLLLPFAIGYRGGAWPVVALAVAIAANLAMLWYRAVRGGATSAWAMALRNVGLIVFVAHLFSPFLLAPAIAVLTTMSSLQTNLYADTRRVVVLVAAMAAAILGTWVLEATEVLHATLTVTPGAFVMETPVLDQSAVLRVGGLVVFVIATLTYGAFVGHTTRSAERSARRQLELQAWQLRQLVPG